MTAGGPEGAGSMLSRLAVAATPAVLTLYFAFSAGGFFAGSPAVAATVLGVALVLRILIAPEPFAGLGPVLVAAAACLGLFAVWTLLSAIWSDAAGQAMIEFDRALLYWLALVFFGSFPHDRRTLEWALRGLAMAIFAIAAAALITRVLPEVWTERSIVETSRLSYPLTYWNALGLLVAVGIVICTHLASATSGSRVVRSLGAAAVPLLASTLYFTFSRGAIAAMAIGLLAYLIVGHPRGLLSAAIAIGPATAVAVAVSYGAELLAKGSYDSPAGIDQGGDVALLVTVCMLAAGALRLLLAGVLDPRLEGVAPTNRGRRLAWGGVAAVAVAGLVAALALGAPSRIGDQIDSFSDGGLIQDTGDLRGRLTEVSNNGRVAQWTVALDTFEASPVHGEGAGTFPRIWARDGEEGLKVEDAHSLYLEALAELGIVGFVLLVGALVIPLVALAAAPQRRWLAAPVFAAGLAWAIHAGVDWDWEMPATGIWFFALAGLTLSRPPEATRRMPVPPRFARLLLAVGGLVLLLTPALMALSQRHLNSAVTKLEEGDCTAASEEALSAARLVSARPQPFQILSYCNSRAGEHELAIDMAKAAVERDPQSWVSLYGLALVQGAAGEDPRAAARRALELNPNAPLTQAAVEWFDTSDPKEWERRALAARLPIL